MLEISGDSISLKKKSRTAGGSPKKTDLSPEEKHFKFVNIKIKSPTNKKLASQTKSVKKSEVEKKTVDISLPPIQAKAKGKSVLDEAERRLANPDKYGGLESVFIRFNHYNKLFKTHNR